MKKILIYILVFTICLTSVTSTYALEDISIQSVGKNEIEPNNTLDKAQAINQDDTIYGKISSTSDVDYYTVTMPAAGKANFWLGDIPNDCNYDLYVYSASGGLLFYSTTTNSQELISNKPVGKNTKLYIKVISASGYSTSQNYRLRVKLNMDNYVFFCQKAVVNGGFNFYDNNISNTYLKYVWQGKEQVFNFKDDIVVAGCALSSYAMILNNLARYTSSTYKDVRYGGTGAPYAKRIADPISVAYANVDYPQAVDYTENPGKYLLNCSGSPVNMNFANVASKFGVTNQNKSLVGFSDTKKKNHIAYYLTLHPEGICVMFKKNGSDSDTHMIVFANTSYEVPIGFTPEATTVSSNELVIYKPTTEEEIREYKSRFDNIGTQAVISDGDKFTVYDPARITDDGVSLSNSWTATHYNWSDLSYVCMVNY